jgi:hypothetical protein
MVMSWSTARDALLSLVRRAISTPQTLRPLVAAAPAGPATQQVPAGDPESEASPPPIPETIPEPDDAVAPHPAQQLASMLIPMPPQPRCQFPSEVGYQWMTSHRWTSTPTGSGLECEACGERWPKMEASA